MSSPPTHGDRGHTLAETRPSGPAGPDAGEIPCLAVAMEWEQPVQTPSWHSLAEVDEVIIGRGPARSHDRYRHEDRRCLRISVPSGRMSLLHARLRRGPAGWVVEDAGSKNGTLLGGVAVSSAALGREAVIEAGRTLFVFRAAAPPCPHEPEDLVLAPGSARGQLPTLSSALRRELHRLSRIARSDVPVLILGETGTGKELAARALHEASGRSGPLVGINCGALPESIIESELFGHRRGAFSGALEEHEGLIRAAHGGTLFLDEIAELPPSSQVALLRVLQERHVRPVGGRHAIPVDIRVVAATLQDVAGRVAEGTFREDLYARLAGLVVELPPLRERREDLGLLASTIIEREARERSVRLDRDAIRAIFAHDWPLNVRELEHALRAALALAEGDEIRLEHLPRTVQHALAAAPAQPKRNVESTLGRQLTDLLREHHGNVSAVARAMGKAPAQIYRWLRRYGIDAGEYREA